MLKILVADVISLPNKLNKKTIFRIPPITEPSLWVFAPNGITVSAISSGTPIFFVASKLTGIDAAEEQVAIAVIEGAAAFSKTA